MTALVFLYSTLAVPLAEANFWSERRKAAADRSRPASQPQFAQLPNALPAIGPALPVVTRSATLSGPLARLARASGRIPASVASIPAAYADIRRIHLAREDRKTSPILIIQDVHEVHAAQQNISRLLEHVRPSLVALEGSSGGFDLEAFRAFRGTERHADISDHLLRNGSLNGAEHYALLTADAPNLLGAEDAALYGANVRAYRDSVQAKPALDAALRRWSAAADGLKAARFTPELRALDRDVAAFHAGELALTAYAKTLAAGAGDLARHPELRRFLEAAALEESLDFARVETERNRVVEALSWKMSQDDLGELVRRSLSYRLGEIGFSDYYLFVRELAGRHGVSLAETPAFETYIRYVVLTEKIDGEALFRELEAAKTAAASRLAADPAQKELFAAAEDLRLLETLSGHAFGPGEWEVFAARRPDVLRLGERLSQPDAALAGLLKPFEDFYRAAEERNEALVANFLSRAPAAGTPVLIAGGFHTPGLEALLRRKGLSYVTLAPKIGAVEDGTKYLDVFTREHTPLERSLLGEKLYLSPPAALSLKLPAGFGYLRDVVEATYVSLDAASIAADAFGDRRAEAAAYQKVLAEQNTLRERFPKVDIQVLDVAMDKRGRVAVRMSLNGAEFVYVLSRRQEIVRGEVRPESETSLLLNSPVDLWDHEQVLVTDYVGKYSFVLARRPSGSLREWARVVSGRWSAAQKYGAAGAGLAAAFVLGYLLSASANLKLTALALVAMGVQSLSSKAKGGRPLGGTERMGGLVAELRELEAKLRLGGGADKIAKQHDSGKLTARERIENLVDAGSPFLEVGLLVAHDRYGGQAPAAGVVTGIGRVEGRPAVIVANDATVKAGSWWPETIEKILRAQEIAIRNRLPIVYLVDSSGVNLPYQGGVFPGARGASRIFYYNSMMKKLGIPQMAAVMGPCIAGGAYLPALSDFIIMVDKTSFMGLAGPNLVKAATGEKIDGESLGGSVTHTEISKVAHYRADDDPAALDLIRRKFQDLPAADALPESIAPDAAAPDVYDVLPADHQKPYRAEDVIAGIVDAGSLAESEAGAAPELLTATARIAGRRVAIVANRRGAFKTADGLRIGGVIYTESARKAARFVEEADKAGLPLVYIQDVSGFMVGGAAEKSGIIRAGAEMVYSMATASVPKIVLTLNHASGAGYYAMAGQGFDPDFTFAWPTARIGVMEGESAVQAVHGPELAALKKQNLPVPAELAEAMARTRADYERWLDAKHAGARGHVDAVIDPKETRDVLAFALEAAGKHKDLVEDLHPRLDRMSLFKGSEIYEKYAAPFWESWLLGGLVTGLSLEVFLGALHLPFLSELGHEALGGFALFLVIQAGWRELLAVRLYARLHKGRREAGDAIRTIDRESFLAASAGAALLLLSSLYFVGQFTAPALISMSSAAYLLTHWVLHTGHNMRVEAKRRLSLLGEAPGGAGRVGFEAGLDAIEARVYPDGRRSSSWDFSSRVTDSLRNRTLRWLKDLDGAQRQNLAVRLSAFLDSNLSNKFFPGGASGTMRRLLGKDQRTSYPAGEVMAARFVQVFKPEALQAQVEVLAGLFPAIDETVSHESFFKALDASAASLLEGVPVAADDADQVAQELRLALYGALLARGRVGARNVTVGLTTSRDGQQSNVGTAFTGEDQRRLIALQSDLGRGIHDMETWGGAVIQTAVLESIRKDKPEDPWNNLREQTGLLESKFREALAPYGAVISPEDQALLMDRFRRSVDRRLLDRPQVEALLAKYALIPEAERARLADRYQQRQEMLLRGQYIVGLAPYPDSVLELFVNTAFKNGVDIFRVFDAFNDTRNIVKAVRFARKIGAKVQPVIHYTTDFPTGIEGYVRIARELVAEAGEALDALTIKDAGGILEPDQAFALLKALRAAGLTVPIHLHTHDTRGNRQLTLLEAIRGNGPDHPIIVDVGVGKENLSAPFGQPDLRDFLGLVKGTAWGKGLDIDEGKLAEIEDVIKRELMPKYPKPLAASSRDRRNAVWARMPGGMKTNFLDRQSMKVLPGYAAGLIRPKYGVVMFDDKNELTPDGRLFLDAFLDLIYAEMRDVTTDMGGISLVTPTSQWIGVQAFNNTIHWLQSGWLSLDKSGGKWTLARGPSFPADRADAYKALAGDLSNYLLIWSQDDHLQKLYPGANRELVRRALAGVANAGQDAPVKLGAPAHRFVERLGQEEVLKHALPPAGPVNREAVAALLTHLQGIRAAVGKDVVDMAVVSIFETFKRHAAATPDGIAARALEYDRFTRHIVMTVLDGEPNVNIPQPLEELREKAAAARKKYPGMTDSDEDLLLLALFPGLDQSLHLFARRSTLLDKLKGLSDPAALAPVLRELAVMGAKPMVAALALFAFLGLSPEAQAQTLGALPPEGTSPTVALAWTLLAVTAAALLWRGWRWLRRKPAPVEHVQEGSWVSHEQWMNSELGHRRMLRLNLVGPHDLDFLERDAELGGLRYGNLIEVRDGSPVFIFYELPDAGPAGRTLRFLTLDEVRALAPKRSSIVPDVPMPDDLAKSVRSAIFLEARAITYRQTMGKPFSGFDRDLDEAAARMTRNGDIESGANGLIWNHGWKLRNVMKELIEGRTLAGASVMDLDRERLLTVFGLAGRDHRKAYEEAMRIMGTHTKFIALAYVLSEAFPTSNKGPRYYNSLARPNGPLSKLGIAYHELSHALAALSVGVLQRPDLRDGHARSVAWLGRRIGPARDAWITLGGIVPFVPLALTAAAGWLVPHLLAMIYEQWGTVAAAAALAAVLAAWTLLIALPAWLNARESWKTRHHRFSDYTRLRKDIRILRRPKGVVWEPADGGFSADNTNVGRLMKRLGVGSYEKLLEFSQKTPELFWSAAAGPKGDLGLEWFKPYRESHDEVVADETRWFVGGKINLYHNAVEKHVRDGAGHQEAIVWRGEDGGRRRMTYGELHEQAGRAAAAFARLGVGQGTTVGLVMSPTPESAAAMLALWKLGAVACPIFTAFGAPLIAERLKETRAEIVVTVDGVLHNGKLSKSPGASGAEVPLGKDMVDEAVKSAPSVKRVVVFRRLTDAQRPAAEVPMKRGRDIWWDDFIAAAAADRVPDTVHTDADAPAIYHYSSGTTGAPKGLVHTHGGLSANVVKELAYHFDVKPGDRFAGWDEAGWMMGPWKIIGVLSQRATVVMLDGSLTRPKNRIWSILEEEGVTHFGLSPNLIRSMAADPDVLADVRRRRFPDLRVLGSTGSPWDKTSWLWLFEKVGKRRTPIINISGGTDLYGALLANGPLTPMKPMTMWPALGMRIDAVDDQGRPVPDGTPGTLVWKGPFGPSQTRGLVNDASGERFRKAYFASFPGLWDHGDRVVRNGKFWEVLGRTGDSYKHNGKWVSSGEVENAVLTHPAVREAANIGVPNPATDNDLVVFAVLKEGVEPTEALAGEIGQSVAKHLGKTFPVKAVHFLPALPKTQSQKSMHRLLRDAYLGNPLGDTSAMQPEAAGAIETVRFIGAGARGKAAPEDSRPSSSRLRLKFAASYLVVGLLAVGAFQLGLFTTGSAALKIATFTVFTGITDFMGQWMSLKPGRKIRWKQALLAVFPIGPLMGAITVYGFPLSGAAAGLVMPFLSFALPGLWNFLLVSVVGFILFGAVNDLFDQWLASRKGEPFRWRRLAAASLQEGPAMGLIAWSSLVLIGVFIPFADSWMAVAGQTFGTVLFMFFVRARTIIYSSFVKKVRLSDGDYGEKDRAEASESAEKQTEVFWVARHLSVLKNFFTFGNAVIEGIFNQLFQLFYTWGTNKDGFLVKDEKKRRNRVYLMLYPLILLGRGAGALLKKLRPGADATDGAPWHSLTEEQIRLMADIEKVQASAEAVKSVFDSYLFQFRKSAGLARLAFEKTDKELFTRTDMERQRLYRTSIDKAVQIVGQILKDEVKDPARWAAVQAEFDRRVSGRFEIDIAETFFRSVHGRFFPDTVTDVETFRQEFVAEDAVPDPTPIYKTIPFRGDDMHRQVERVLNEFPVNVPYKSRREDARLAAGRIEAALAALPYPGEVESFELARKLFYRGRAAYVVGRIRFKDGRHVPLVINILNTGQGAIIRAVFVGEDAVSPIFSFTRSSFHVDTDRYHDLVVFLKETMPKKKESIFYFSLGFDDHAETKQLEGIAKKLRAAREAAEKLSMAAGRPGGAMTVFTMPNLDLVFKVIRDRMAYGKERTPGQVRGTYDMVHRIDRLGRMVDTLTFRNLRFPADMFEPKFLEVLKQNVPDTAKYEGNDVVFQELFTQRRTIPLPVFFDMYKDDKEKCLRVVSDLGFLLRELAMSNVYMGDFHMSNFGVMDSGRVVLFDFDEMEPLTSDRVSIKDIPDWLRRYSEENGDGEPGMWPHMAPEELRLFLVPNAYYKEFDQEHGILLSDKWWNEIKDRLKVEHRIEFEPHYLRPYLLHPEEVDPGAAPAAGAYHHIAGDTLVPFGQLLERALRAAAGALRPAAPGRLGELARRNADSAALDPYERSAWRLAASFESVLDLYQETSLQAEAAFKHAKGEDFHKADIARLDSYEERLRRTMEQVRGVLGERLQEEQLGRLKTAFEEVMRRHPQRRIAGLFYMDLIRRLEAGAFSLEAYERLSPDFSQEQRPLDGSFTRALAVDGDLGGAVRRMLDDVFSDVRFSDLDADLGQTMEYMAAHVGGLEDVTTLDFVVQPLYRGNNAYVLARLRNGSAMVPFVFSIENGADGARIGYVYLDSEEIRNIFSYTRSSLYFSTEAYDELVEFIQTLIPHKRLATVYFSIGFPELAHAEILREISESVRGPAAGGKFAFSAGKPGALLVAFDKPDLPYVLKVLRDEDRFGKGNGQLKTGMVKDQYDFVHHAYRFTRILDNLEYEDVAIPRSAFSDDLLAELTAQAGNNVAIVGDSVVFKHLVIQRKVTPLSLFMKEHSRRAVFQAGELDVPALKAMLAGRAEPSTDLQKAVIDSIRTQRTADEIEAMDEERILREVNSAIYGGFGSSLWRSIFKRRGWRSVDEIQTGEFELSGRARELLAKAAAGEELNYAVGMDDFAALNRAVFQAVFPAESKASAAFDRGVEQKEERVRALAVDIGHLIKELAYSGLFYDDFNRHNIGLLSGRAVIFDLDGFEKLIEHDFSGFSLEGFLFDDALSGLPRALLEPMRQAHPEIFESAWWVGVVEKLKADSDGKLDFIPALKLENQLPHEAKGPAPQAAGAADGKAAASIPGDVLSEEWDKVSPRLAKMIEHIRRVDLARFTTWTRAAFLAAFDIISRLFVRPYTDEEVERVRAAVESFKFAGLQNGRGAGALALPELQVLGRVRYEGVSSDKTQANFRLKTNAGWMRVRIQAAKGLPYGTLFADDGTHVAATIQGPPAPGSLADGLFGLSIARLLRRPVSEYTITLQPDTLENPALLYRALVEDLNEVKAMAEGLTTELAHRKFHGELATRNNLAFDQSRQFAARDYSAWLPPVRPALALRFGSPDRGGFRIEQLRKNVSLLAALALSGSEGGYAGFGTTRGEMDAFIDDLERISLRNLPRGAADGSDEALFARAVEDLKKASADFAKLYQDDPQTLRRQFGLRAAGVAVTLGAAKDVSSDFGEAAEDWLVRDLLAARDLLSTEAASGAQLKAARTLVSLGARLRRQESALPEKAPALNLADLRGAMAQNADYAALIGAGVGRIVELEDGSTAADLTVLVTDEAGVDALRARLEALRDGAPAGAAEAIQKLIDGLGDRSKVLLLTPKDLQPSLRDGRVVDVARLLESPGLEAWKTGDRPIRIQTADPSLWWTGGLPETRQALVEFLLWVTKDAFFRARKGDIEEYLEAVRVLNIQA